ncbi:MAG: hypothetical protein ACRETQ_10420 [Gammaproteobacteria bacterium]
MLSLPQTPQPPLRVWSKGVALGAAAFSRLFLYTSLIAILGLLPRLYLDLRLGTDTMTAEHVRAALDLSWILLEVACVLVSLLVQALIIARLEQFAQTARAATAGAWRQAARSWLPLIGTVVLCLLILFFSALIAALVGGIVAAVAKGAIGREGAVAIVMALMLVVVVILGVYLIFVQFAVVLEKRRPLAAIDLSFNLVRGNWWRTFAVLLVTGVVIAAILMLVSLPLDSAFGWHGGVQTGRTMLEKAILQMVVSALSAPFIISILYVQYLDLKLRRAAAPPLPTAAFQA